MNASLSAVTPLLNAPWRWRLNSSSTQQRIGGALVLVLLLGLVYVFKGWLAAALSAGVGAAGLGVTAWLLTLSGLLRQNHPMLARLLPGHVRRLRLAVLLLWGLPVFLAGIGAICLAADVWKVVLQTALLLSLLTLFVRWPLSFVLVWFVPPVLMPLWQDLALSQALSQLWRAQWQSGPAWLSLPLLAGLALFQASVIGPGDEAHKRRYQRLLGIVSSLQDGAGGPSVRHLDRWGLWWNRLFSLLARGWLSHLLRHPRASEHHCLARMEFPLYGATHWTQIAGTFLLVLPMIGLGFVLLSLVVPAMSWQHGPWRHLPQAWWLLGLGQTLMGMATSLIFNLGSSLERSRKEQALLMLLPGVPTQGRLRAGLLQRQGLQIACLAWPGLCLIGQAELPAPATLLQGFGVGMVLASFMLLKPWAGQRSPGSARILVLAAIVAMAWQYLLPDLLGRAERQALSLALLLLTMAGWAWALHRIRREASPALPWGRRPC